MELKNKLALPKWLVTSMVIIIFALIILAILFHEKVTDHAALITALVGILTVFAIYYAPIVALKIQKEIESINERTSRKLNIFKTLLATRAVPVSREHVQALNMIDIEFYNEKKICHPWNVYRDYLNSFDEAQKSSEYNKAWEEKRKELLTELLYAMSEFFGYDFDKVVLQKGAYFPKSHGFLEIEAAVIRQSIIAVLNGHRAIKIESVDAPKENAN